MPKSNVEYIFEHNNSFIEKIVELSFDFQDYKNGEIMRYNGKHKIKEESIAEHSFMVAMNVIKVCQAMGIKDEIRNKATTMAILHDVSERYVGDIAFEFKSLEENKNILSDLFENFEKRLYQDKYKEEVGEIYKDVYQENNDVCGRLINLADSMSVVQYSAREISLGNSVGEMSRINREAMNRVDYDYRRLMKAIKEEEESVWGS